MAYLIDTSILGRVVNSADAQYAIATRAVETLHQNGEVLHVTAQNLIEFRNFATRPVSANGLGLSPSEAELKAAVIEAVFPLVRETSRIFPAWKTLVHLGAVAGKQVHDARLIAVCQTHGITHLLTFNTQHFVRFARFNPRITIVDPTTV